MSNMNIFFYFQYKSCIHFLDVGQALKMTIKSDGYSSLWRGLGPTILRDIPFSGKILFKLNLKKKQYSFL